MFGFTGTKASLFMALATLLQGEGKHFTFVADHEENSLFDDPEPVDVYEASTIGTQISLQKEEPDTGVISLSYCKPDDTFNQNEAKIWLTEFCTERLSRFFCWEKFPHLFKTYLRPDEGATLIYERIGPVGQSYNKIINTRTYIVPVGIEKNMIGEYVYLCAVSESPDFLSFEPTIRADVSIFGEFLEEVDTDQGD